LRRSDGHRPVRSLCTSLDFVSDGLYIGSWAVASHLQLAARMGHKGGSGGRRRCTLPPLRVLGGRMAALLFFLLVSRPLSYIKQSSVDWVNAEELRWVLGAEG